jgi:general nucleoside transport system ATP-binding protein
VSLTESQPVQIRIGAHNLTRKYGSVIANDAVELAVAPGTIHSIVGGNGAGKSTLMRILQGVDWPDEGAVILDNQPVRLAGPADAFARGVGMVHQEFMLAAPLTLLENLILGREPIRGNGLIDWPKAKAEAASLAGLAGVEIDWDMKASDAPIHVRQILEILRLLYRGADVLILDEPTAVLAPLQIKELLKLMRKLKAEGRTILFISHKLEEVLNCSDAITVMRAGRIVANTTAVTTTVGALAHAMIGDNVPAPLIASHALPTGDPLFSIRGVVAQDHVGFERLGPLDLDIRPGEIVGVAGVGGNGQDELVGCAAGILSPIAGAIRLAGADLTTASAARFRRAGVGYVSADRRHEGLCLAAPLTENFIAGREHDRAFSRLGFLRGANIRWEAARAFERLGVRYGALGDPAGTLSGGNQQRLAISRELSREPKLLVVAQPTRGVDIAGSVFIHNLMAAFRDRGGAVLLVSESLDEILALSDRIVCLFNGQIVGALNRPEASVETVGRMMLGRKAAA